MERTRVHLKGCTARFVRGAECLCEDRIRSYGGYINAFLLVVVAAFVAARTYERYLNPMEVVEGWMIAAAFAGAVLNWGQHEILHGPGEERARYMRVLEVGIFIFVMEIVVGVVSGSLALEADAWHVLVDNGAVAVSLFVAWLFPGRIDRNHVTHTSLDGHILGDLLQSVAVIGAGTWMYYTGDHTVDVKVSGTIALVLLVWAFVIARSSYRGTFAAER